jgi:hypothetical protein
MPFFGLHYFQDCLQDFSLLQNNKATRYAGGFVNSIL